MLLKSMVRCLLFLVILVGAATEALPKQLRIRVVEQLGAVSGVENVLAQCSINSDSERLEPELVPMTDPSTGDQWSQATEFDLYNYNRL